MKHQKKSSREKYWTIIGIIALFVLAGLTYFVFFNSTYSSSDSSPPSDKPAESSGTKTPTNSSDEEETTNSAKNQKDADEPSNPDESVSIIAAYVNGSTFDIRTSIRSVTDTGTCELTMKRGGASYSAQAGVQALPSSSTCKGFDVPMSALSSGTWNITVTYLSGSSIFTATKEVVINA